MIVEFSVPLHLLSVNKTRNRHHMARYREDQAQAQAVHTAWLGYVNRRQREALKLAAQNGTLNVRITRLGHRRMDDDNLAGAAKKVRDVVAEILGIDDGDPRCKWEYTSAHGVEYSVVIRIEAE